MQSLFTKPDKSKKIDFINNIISKKCLINHKPIYITLWLNVCILKSHTQQIMHTSYTFFFQSGLRSVFVCTARNIHKYCEFQTKCCHVLL